MKNLTRILAAGLSLLPIAARADEQPRAGATPAWVALAAAPPTAPAGDQPLRVLLQDQQIWFHGGTTSLYQHRILRIDRPEGLQAMMRLSVQWRPETDRLTIHSFNLTRGARQNDLLGAVQEVLARRSVNAGGLRMDGQRSLGLPIAGMQVGDVVEIAYSIDRAEPLLGGHHEMVVDVGTRGGIDRLVLAARWDQAVPMAVAGRNLPAPMTQAPGRVQLLAEAPIAESKAGRMIEFSDFRQWSEVAGIFQPLFAQARMTGEGSPIRAEVARIKAEARDPLAQAGMALAVAQARVKYLYVGLGEGNLRPMPADQVWQRGFADCKGKAALLLAMLDGLGIAAEPALVATRGGEQLDRRLPNVTGFDHVIVRAEIAGRVFWLDPTQDAIAGGDLAAKDLVARGAQQFGWALPVRLGAGLEAMTGVRAARRSGAGPRNP